MRSSSSVTSALLWLSAVALIFLWWGLGEPGTYDWQWQRALRYVCSWDGGPVPGPLLLGLGLTLRIVVVSLLLATALGLGTALLRQGPSLVGRGLACGYVGLVRNTPLLIQLFAMYFVLAPLLGLGPFGAAVWALSLFEGAYMAEVFRGGLAAVPRNQWDAAHSLGFPRTAAFVHIILPQVLRHVLPPMTSQIVSLIKDSALVSAIALPDVTMRAQVIIADTFLSLELWSLVALLYLLLTLLVTIPARYIEKSYVWRWI